MAATLTMTSLVGCGSSDTQTNSNGTDTSTTTTETTPSEDSTESSSDTLIYDARTATVYLNGMDEEQKTIDAIAELESMEKYQNITFNWVGRDADFNTKMPVEVAGGVEIDLIIVANPIFLTTYANNGLLLPLDDLAADVNMDFSVEFGEYAENAKINGETYMFPHNVTSWAITYNKDVFDAAGVEYPAWDTPMTWDEYAEVAKSITAGSGADKTYGAFYVPWGTFTYGEAIMALGGGEHFYNNEGLSNIEDPAFAEALEGVYNMMHVDGSMQTHANVMSASTQITDFMNGSYGMTIGGGFFINWATLSDMYPRDWRVGLAPMPVDSGNQTKTWGVVNGYGIPVSAPDPAFSFDLAYDLVALSGKYADTAISAIQTVSQDILFVEAAESLADDGITMEMLISIFANPDIYVTEKITGPNNVAYEAVYMEEVEKYLVQAQDLETTIANIKSRGDAAILGD